MEKNYVAKERDKKLMFSETIILDDFSAIKSLDNPTRQNILKALEKKPMYPAQIAKHLKMHEQNVYYHIKQMHDSGVLEIIEKKEIRGTTAKKFSPKSMNFSVCLSKDWKEFGQFDNRDEQVIRFLKPFLKNGKLDSEVIVGSPDPHGPHKARARDGHYAIDLALFLGNFCKIQKGFSTKLDVDSSDKKNMIIVGGPVTNLKCAMINPYLPAKFSDKKPWGIITSKGTYTDESVGLIARIKNPSEKGKWIMVFAGIRFIGTKAAVMAFTRNHKKVLEKFSGQDEFFCIVQGFDLDGDGRIDSTEIIE